MKETTLALKVCELVEDFDLLPRAAIDSQNVAAIRRAIRARSELPPIVVDQKTKRIADGFHRKRAYEQELGVDHVLKVRAIAFPNATAIYVYACNANSAHGRNLSSYDRVHAANRAQEIYHMNLPAIARALHMTSDDLKTLMVRKTAFRPVIDENGEEVYDDKGNVQIKPCTIKNPISGKAGCTLTTKQASVIPSLGGQTQMRLVNELIRLLESDFWDSENPALQQRAAVLWQLLGAQIPAEILEGSEVVESVQ